MKTIPRRLWAYIRPYGWALAASLVLVAVVGILEAVSPFLIGLIFDTLLQRERLGSTGVGRGIAIPHGRLPALKSIVTVFARLDEPGSALAQLFSRDSLRHQQHFRSVNSTQAPENGMDLVHILGPVDDELELVVVMVHKRLDDVDV